MSRGVRPDSPAPTAFDVFFWDVTYWLNFKAEFKEFPESLLNNQSELDDDHWCSCAWHDYQ
jgi:hypothetical protein